MEKRVETAEQKLQSRDLQTKKTRVTRWKDELIDLIKVLVIALLIAGAVRTFLYEPFNIPSESMVPTLLEGDYIFVSKFSYGYGPYSFPLVAMPIQDRWLGQTPQRGEVLVFRNEKDVDASGRPKDYVKRLIGMPGDRIQVQDGLLYINDIPVIRERVADFIHPDRGNAIPQYIETLPNGVQHPILEQYGDHGGFDNTPVYEVPEGHYFMMGDHRDNSNDSRNPLVVGFVPEANLIGRVEVIFFSHGPMPDLWEFYKWPFQIRFGRLLQAIH